MPKTIMPKQNVPADQPPPPPRRKSSGKWIPLLLLFLLPYIGLNVWVYLYGPRIFGTKLGTIARRVTIVQPQETRPPPTPTPTPTPTPIQLRPDDGVKGTYSVSQGKHNGPSESQIIFDPLDVQKGQHFTITVKLTDTAPIQTVTGVLETDHGSQNVVFERIGGTELTGTWQGTMTLQDTVFYTYTMKVTATSTNGTSTAITAPRS